MDNSILSENFDSFLEVRSFAFIIFDTLCQLLR
jgi:hypothetical protein